MKDDDEDFAKAATADISDYSTVDINDGDQQPVLLYIDTEHNIIMQASHSSLNSFKNLLVLKCPLKPVTCP